LPVVAHIERTVERHLRGLLLEVFPALLVTGPRAVGKTTSMRTLATTRLDLSIPAVRSAMASDPDAALDGLPEPILIDEWQEVPDVVGAVKRSVDRDPRPARFVLTGSVRSRLTNGTWGGTGRLIRVPMYGLSQAEIEGNPGVNPLDAAFENPEHLTRAGIVDLDRNSYISSALAGGFPSSYNLAEQARRIWFRSYVEQVIDRDAVALGGLREPAKLRSVLQVVAARTSQEQNLERMGMEAGVTRVTLGTHLDLLENLQLLTRLPAWTPNRLRRLVRAPKVHLTDTGLTAALLGTDARAVRLDGPLAGALIESLATNELLRAAVFTRVPTTLHHLRTQDQYEVDILAVADDGRVIAFEVKAATKVTSADTRGLRWLRDHIGDDFVSGYLLHTGPFAHRLDDRIWAIPLAALWRPVVERDRPAPSA
jgi:predicted AAA+ superfamily ATPase